MSTEDKATKWWNSLDDRARRTILDKHSTTMYRSILAVKDYEIKQLYIQEAGYLDNVHGF